MQLSNVKISKKTHFFNKSIVMLMRNMEKDSKISSIEKVCTFYSKIFVILF